jgi:serine phosphatase RsbU (regulator of sigma subunit)
VTQAVALTPGSRISVGGHQLLYERRSRRELDEAEALERELHRANQYVLAILPLPLREGPVQAEWYYLPCTSLGGDAFGYRDLGGGMYAGYILDVAGHGVGAAMHSVSVANVLRQDGMLGADLRDPAAVMTRLNESFPMETHDGLFFTAWYWVYDLGRRVLTYCSAGHHAGYVKGLGAREAKPLQARNPAIGFMPGVRFRSERVDIAQGSTLYLFSDGVFEIEDAAQRRWAIEDFVAILGEPPRAGVTEPQRIFERVREASRPGPLDDDFSLVAIRFP